MDCHRFASLIRLQQLSKAMTQAARGELDADRLDTRDPEFLGLLQFRPLRFSRSNIVLAVSGISLRRLPIGGEVAVVRDEGVLSLNEISALRAAEFGFELLCVTIFCRQI